MPARFNRELYTYTIKAYLNGKLIYSGKSYIKYGYVRIPFGHEDTTRIENFDDLALKANILGLEYDEEKDIVRVYNTVAKRKTFKSFERTVVFDYAPNNTTIYDLMKSLPAEQFIDYVNDKVKKDNYLKG